MKALLPALNYLLEKGVIALLIFTPLAFGTVQKWSVSLFEIGAYLLLMLFLLKGTMAGFGADNSEAAYDGGGFEAGGFEPLKKGALKAAVIMLSLFVGLIALQLLPLPDALARTLSPASLQLYEKFGSSASSLHSISINRYATRQELLLLLAYLSVFIVIIGHYRTKKQLRSLVKTIFFTGCFLVLFALLQKATWNGRLYWFYPIDGYLLKSKLDYIWGPFIYRNNFACYLEMVVPFGLGMLIYTAPGRKSSRTALPSNRIAAFIASPNFAVFTSYFAAVLIMTAALFATLSRGGITACVVSFVFFVWLTRKRSSLESRSLFIAMLALVIAAVVVFAAWDRIENRFENAGYIDRATVWKDSLGIVRDYPLFGSGLGTFESAYLRYQSKGSSALFDHAHNDYVEILTDTGVTGTALAGGAALLLFASLYRRWRAKRSTYAQCIGAGGLSAAAALAAHSFTDFNLRLPATALLFTVVVAITYVAVYNVSDRRSASLFIPHPSPLTPHTSLLTRYASRLIIFFFALLLYFPVTSFLADYNYGQVSRILDDPLTDYQDRKPLMTATLPDYLAALRAAQRANNLEPAYALYAATVAEHYTRLGRWAAALELPETPLPDHSFQEAERYLRVAIRLEPTNPDYHLALADIYEVYRQDVLKVDAELKLAAEAFPFNGAVRNAVAMHYLLAGRKEEALSQARLLAKNDDSYLLNESPQKAETLESMPQWYLNMIYRSYLFNALEIAWRIARDPALLESMAPDTPEGQLVLDEFLDSKGIYLEQ